MKSHSIELHLPQLVRLSLSVLCYEHMVRCLDAIHSAKIDTLFLYSCAYKSLLSMKCPKLSFRNQSLFETVRKLSLDFPAPCYPVLISQMKFPHISELMVAARPGMEKLHPDTDPGEYFQFYDLQDLCIRLDIEEVYAPPEASY